VIDRDQLDALIAKTILPMAHNSTYEARACGAEMLRDAILAAPPQQDEIVEAPDPYEFAEMMDFAAHMEGVHGVHHDTAWGTDRWTLHEIHWRSHAAPPVPLSDPELEWIGDIEEGSIYAHGAGNIWSIIGFPFFTDGETYRLSYASHLGRGTVEELKTLAAQITHVLSARAAAPEPLSDPNRLAEVEQRRQKADPRRDWLDKKDRK
jgi:hypothetical protein